MAGGVVDVLRVVYQIDVVDKGTRHLLASERQAQKSVVQTSRSLARRDTALRRSTTVATTTATRRVRALEQEGRAATFSAAGTTRLAAAQKASSSAAAKATWSARQVTAAYQAQERASERLTRAERARAAAAKATATASVTAARSARGSTAAMAGGAAALGRATPGVLGPAAVAAGGIGAVKIFAGFEKEMDRVGALSEATRRQLASLTSQAQELGATTNFSNREVAGGMSELAAAGFKVREIIKTIPGTLSLAAASGTDLANAAAIQATQLRAFSLPASKAGHVADVLTVAVNRSAISMEDLGESMSYVAPVAGRFNQSFEDMSAAVAILGNVGIKGSMAGTAIRRGLVSVIKPSNKTMDALNAVGISTDRFSTIVNDSQGRLRPMPKILGGLATALRGVDAASKRRVLAQLFGTEALPGMVTLVGKGEKGINEMSRAMRNARGEANRTAKEMRDNVSGAFDNLTGAVESAATALVSKRSGALKTGLQNAAGFITALVSPAKKRPAVPSTAVGERALGAEAARANRAPVAIGERALGQVGARSRGAPAAPTAAQNAAAKVRVALSAIGEQARKLGPILLNAGRQLLDAFKPAMPFLRNVLLPLLKGVATGVIGGIVVAFKIAVPIIKAVATVLGFLGKAARPLRGVFEGIGTVIGFVFSGAILKVLGQIPKVGIVFKLLAVPIRFVAGVIGRVAGVFGKLPGAATSAAGRVVDAIAKLPGKIGGLAGRIAKGAVGIGKGIIGGIVSGLRSAAGRIASFLGGVLKKAWDKLKGGGVPFIPGVRRGGKITATGSVRRFNSGGLIPIVASGGELMVHHGRAGVIPGPSDRDATPMLAPAGAAILTGDGQARMAMGASLGEAIRSQAPHFMAGGRVAEVARRAGFRSRSLVTSLAVSKAESGWDETASNKNKDGTIDRGLWQINSVHGTLSTFAPQANANAAFKISGGGKNWRPWVAYKTGAHSRHMGAARVAAGKSAASGPSRSALEAQIERNMDQLDRLRDQVAAITGKNATSRRRPLQAQVRNLVSQNRKLRGQIRDLPKDSGRTAPTVYGKSRRRAGLLTDAFAQGQTAGQAGLTRGIIRREGNPILDAIRGAQTSTVREVAIPGTKGKSTTGGTSAIRAGGGWGGSENIIRSAIRGLGSATFKRPANHPLSIKNPGSDHNMANKTAFAADLPPGDRIFNTLRQRLNIPARKGAWNKFANKPVRGYRSQLLWHAPDGSHKDHVHVGAKKMRRGGIIGRYRPGGFVAGMRPTGPPGGAAGTALSGGLRTAMSFAGGSLEALDAIIGRSMQQRLVALREQLLARVRKGGPKKVLQRLQGVIDMIDFEMGRRVGRIQDVVEQRARQVDRQRGQFDRGQRARGVDPSSLQGVVELSGMQAAETEVRKQNVASLENALRIAGQAKNREAVREITTQLEDAQDALQESVVVQIELARAAAEALKQAVQDAAQKVVDEATSRSTIADLGLQRLELEQRLIGTHSSTGAAQGRADFIRQQIIPAIQAEIAALELQRQVAQATGNADLVRQLNEQIFGRQNSVLEQMLAANEQTAENTELLKEFGGSSAFSYRDQVFTDLDVIKSRMGA